MANKGLIYRSVDLSCSNSIHFSSNWPVRSFSTLLVSAQQKYMQLPNLRRNWNESIVNFSLFCCISTLVDEFNIDKSLPFICFAL